MIAKRRSHGDNGSRGWTDIDRCGQATSPAFENARAVLARYDELVATAQRETALLLWRGMAPPRSRAISLPRSMRRSVRSSHPSRKASRSPR